MNVKGFTLIESLMVLAMITIIFGLALPSFHAFFARHQSRIVVNEIAGNFNFARLSAVTTGSTVTVCPRSNNDKECGKDWTKGTMSFTDKNTNGVLDEMEMVLRVTKVLPKNSAAKWVSFGSNNYIRFRNDGTTVNQNGSFTYCPPDKDPAYANQIIVNRSGRLRFAKDNDGNGIKNTARGGDIRCN